MSDFRDLFHEAVDHVEPRPGLDAIHARLSEEPPMNRRWIAPLAAAAAVAAIAGGFLLTSGGDPSGSPDLPPATSPSTPDSPSPSPTSPSPETPDPSPSGETKAVPVYFIGDTPQGPRLFREFHRVPTTNPALGAAVLATSPQALDPDYDTGWPSGTKVNTVEVDGAGADGEITIDLSGDLHDAPAGADERINALALEQLIYSVQGVVGARAPVRFTLDGRITDTVLGVPTSEPLANGPVLDTLALVNLTSPATNEAVEGDTLTVSGVANSFEANVPLRLLQGSTVVWEGFAMAEGCCEEKLFPFTTTVDVSRLPAGTYVLEATTDDPSGGEGPGPHVDTKVIQVG